MFYILLFIFNIVFSYEIKQDFILSFKVLKNIFSKMLVDVSFGGYDFCLFICLFVFRQKGYLLKYFLKLIYFNILKIKNLKEIKLKKKK